MKAVICIINLLLAANCFAQIATVGEALPNWQEGMLDLHHINTGRGDAAFYIFPDGTTMLLDAGEMSPTGDRIFTPRNSKIHPNYSKTPSEWIVNYIQHVYPKKMEVKLDYALITHFHDDHYGAYYPGAKISTAGKYYLTGITGVAEQIPIKLLIDRGYPDYSYPVPLKNKKRILAENIYDEEEYQSFENYWNFIDYQVSKKDMQAASLKAGRDDQIVLVNQPATYPQFSVRNIMSNGIIWSGTGDQTFNYFPDTTGMSWKSRPHENPCSNAIRIDYGPFNYFTGGDIPGVADLGKPKWADLETPAAPIIGEVDIATLNHHGNRDSQNEFYVSTIKPRVWVQQTWSSDHPGHEVLRRITSKFLYPEERDLFATNILEANKNVIGPSLENSYKSTEGHILIRVLKGGKEYYVIILDDETEDYKVTKVFGPYQSKDLLNK